MGVIQYRQGHLPEAEQTLARYCQASMDNPSAAKLLASIRLARGDFAGAADVLKPYLRGSSDPQLYAMHGSAEMRLGNATEAVRSLQRAVELAPDMAPFRNQLALGLLAAGDRQRAEAQLENAVEVDGSQFQSDYLLAMLRIRDRDWAAAGEAVEALVAKAPDNPVGYNLRGAVALGLGRKDAAQKAFARALEVDDSFLPAIRNLARLDEADGHPEQAAARYHGFLRLIPTRKERCWRWRNCRCRAAIGRCHGRSAAKRPSPSGFGAIEGGAGAAVPGVRAARRCRRRGEQGLAQAPDATDLLALGADIALRQGDRKGAREAVDRLGPRRPATLTQDTAGGGNPPGASRPGRGQLDQAASHLARLQHGAGRPRDSTPASGSADRSRPGGRGAPRL